MLNLTLLKVYEAGVEVDVSTFAGHAGPFDNEEQMLTALALAAGSYGSPPVKYGFSFVQGVRSFSFTIDGLLTAVYEIEE